MNLLSATKNTITDFDIVRCSSLFFFVIFWECFPKLYLCWDRKSQEPYTWFLLWRTIWSKEKAQFRLYNLLEIYPRQTVLMHHVLQIKFGATMGRREKQKQVPWLIKGGERTVTCCDQYQHRQIYTRQGQKSLAAPRCWCLCGKPWNRRWKTCPQTGSCEAQSTEKGSLNREYHGKFYLRGGAASTRPRRTRWWDGNPRQWNPSIFLCWPLSTTPFSLSATAKLSISWDWQELSLCSLLSCFDTGYRTHSS